MNKIDPLGLEWWNRAPPKTVPVTGETLANLQCIEKCLGAEEDWDGEGLLCTGGKESEPDENGKLPHSKNSDHYKNEAVDIAGSKFNKYTNTQMNDCAKKCGFGAGHYEDLRGEDADHWHFQKEPGNGVPALP